MSLGSVNTSQMDSIKEPANKPSRLSM